MARHRVRIAKPKPLHPKRRKAKPKTEIVTACDHCGKSLGRTCARTVGSAVCAVGVGVKTRHDSGKHFFYCSDDCAMNHSTPERWPYF